MSDIDYHKYMASREWRLKRKAILDRNGGWCERCHSARVTQVHHLSYEHLGNEQDEELQGLCKACHEFVSAECDQDPAALAVAAMLIKGMEPVFRSENELDWIMWWDCGPFPDDSWCHIQIKDHAELAEKDNIWESAIVIQFTEQRVWFHCAWF